MVSCSFSPILYFGWFEFELHSFGCFYNYIIYVGMCFLSFSQRKLYKFFHHCWRRIFLTNVNFGTFYVKVICGWQNRCALHVYMYRRRIILYFIYILRQYNRRVALLCQSIKYKKIFFFHFLKYAFENFFFSFYTKIGTYMGR